MAKKTINLGTGELTGDGESIRSAFDKINQNFSDLYNIVESIVIPTDISQLSDTQGLLATTFDGGSAASQFNEEETIDGGGA